MIRNFELSKRDNYKIHVTEYVPDCGEIKKVLVMCHGLFGSRNSSTVHLFGERFMKQNMAVVALDLPSHGDSNVDINEFTMYNCIEDIAVVTLYAATLCKYVSIFGTSLGGYCTVNVLEDYHFNYEKVILRAPALCLDELAINSGILGESLEEFKSKREGIRIGENGRIKLTYETIKELQANKVFEKYNGNYNMLIFHGNYDHMAPVDHSIRFANEKKNVILLRYDSDHCNESPEQMEFIFGETVKFLYR